MPAHAASHHHGSGRQPWLPALLLVASLAALLLSNSRDAAAMRQSSGLQQLQLFPGASYSGGELAEAPQTYPRGDCATECSFNPVWRMTNCSAVPAAGIPATRCQPLAAPGEEEPAGVCPTLRYPDAFLPEAYCLPRFAADCAHADNFGCVGRCVLYVLITHHCVSDAFNFSSGSFLPDCTFCNACWDRSQGPTASSTPAARAAPYALLLARGPFGGLFVNHWLVLPKRACSGIESVTPGCTDAAGEYIWANAWAEAERLGFSYAGGPPEWVVWLNAPNRRGMHQMHLHIAAADDARTAPGVPRSAWLLRRVANTTSLSRDPHAPSRVLGEGWFNPTDFKSSPLGRPPLDWARAYAIFVPSPAPAIDLGARIRPFELARRLAAASDLPGHSYGLFIMPRAFEQPGIIVAIAWSTDDGEQLDVRERAGDPIRYSHTCHQYIGTDGTGGGDRGTLAARP